jgi:hypothetical protein
MYHVGFTILIYCDACSTKHKKAIIKKACIPIVPSAVKVGYFLNPRDITVSAINIHCQIKLLFQGGNQKNLKINHNGITWSVNTGCSKQDLFMNSGFGQCK